MKQHSNKTIAELVDGRAYSPGNPDEEKWVIELSSYERHNLLWLLEAVWGNNDHGVEPFGYASTGHWVGMIGWKLKRDGDNWPGLADGDRSNKTLQELRSDVHAWLKRKIDKAIESDRLSRCQEITST
jgi:hypothetical protein